MIKQAAFAFVALLVLVGCGSNPPPKLTGNAVADVTAFQAYVSTTTADLNSKIAKYNAGAVTVALALGKDACGVANNLHAVYVGPLGQIAVEAGSAAAGAPVAAAAADASEAVVFADVQLACKTVDTATAVDQTSPTAAELLAVQTLLNDVPKLQAAVAKVSPTAAALLAPPAKS
jgi:hypothetical protein